MRRPSIRPGRKVNWMSAPVGVHHANGQERYVVKTGTVVMPLEKPWHHSCTVRVRWPDGEYSWVNPECLEVIA
jgi:hypothetical protein